ncbi:MAG: hypothetical protein V1725_02010 [archaeon]
MAKTRQVNLRLSEDLIKELDWIADDLHISKADWIKVKLAEAVKKEGKR